MLRDSGVPVYLRGPSRGLISLALVAFGCAMVYLGTVQGWMLVLVLCFGVGITILGLFRMEWAVLGLVVMANFDGFLKPLFAERFGLFLKDYFILLALVRWLWGLLVGEDRPSLRTIVAVPALVFSGYVLVEILNPNAESLMMSIAGARAWLLWVPLFFVGYDYLQSRAAIERLWFLATVVSGVVAAYGIVQYFIGFEHLYRLSSKFEYYAKMGYVLGTGESVVRVFSTMVHPGTFGGAMAAMALVACGLTFSASRPAWRVVSLVCVPLITVGLFLSGARTAIIGAGAGLVVFFLLSRQPLLLLVGGALLAGGFWQSAQLTGGAVEQRLETVTWDYTTARTLEPFYKGLDVATQHPFGLGVASGVGVGGYDLGKVDRSTPFIENDLGRALGELGIGALLYIVLLAAAAWAATSAHLRLRSAAAAALSAALLGGATSVAVALLTGAALYLAPGALYFWLAVATVMRLPEIEAAERREVESTEEAAA